MVETELAISGLSAIDGISEISGLSVIRHDAFDSMFYEDIYSQSADIQALVERGSQYLETFASLGADVFFSLYKPNPELLAELPMMPELPAVPEYSLHYELMAKLMESPSYQELRQYTQLDELGAGLGTKAMLESFLNQLQEGGTLKEANPKIRQVVELALERSSVILEETESAITSWGLYKGEFSHLPYAKKLEILQVLLSQKKFRDMAKLVGRMRNIAIASRKIKIEQQRVELHSITQGDDINHVLPQELLALRRPALKLDFYRRMMEKQLMQYDLNHKDHVGQGPILALIDTSSSMRSRDREIWSKAVALGLAEIAEKERRGFSYALFASARDNLITDEFQIGQRSPDKLLNMATSFIGGGTDYEQPLQWGLNKLRESKFNKADLVLITDGECSVSSEFLAELQKAKAEKEFRIYSILIGNNPRELGRWSDEVWSIHDLLDDTATNTVQELFHKI